MVCLEWLRSFGMVLLYTCLDLYVMRFFLFLQIRFIRLGFLSRTEFCYCLIKRVISG